MSNQKCSIIVKNITYLPSQFNFMDSNKDFWGKLRTLFMDLNFKNL